MKLLLFPFQIIIAFFIFSSQKIYCCDPHDTLALLKLKAELHANLNPPCGDTSRIVATVTTSNWLNSPNCCNWDGVTCDNAADHVIGLFLLCVRGFITSNSSLFALTHLQSLYLNLNDFQGSSIVPEFGQFKNMTHLGLWDSNFSGDVPLEISHLSKLAYLGISGEIRFSAASFKALSQNLTSLSELNLNGIDLASTHFTNLSSLTSLYLSDCKLHGEILDNIFRLLPKLQVLLLSNNLKLTGHFPNSSIALSIDLPHLLRCGRSLTDLGISGCQFTNSFSQQIPETHIPSNLTRLDLSYNSLNGEIPSWIYKLPYLSYLDLPSNSLTGSLDLKELSNLKQLSILDLSSNSLTGSLDLKELSNLKELSWLDLSFNNLSLHFNNSINYTLPNLYSLALSSCNISEFPNFLRSSKSLYRLDLSSNQLQGSVPKWLWNIGKDSLSSLNLSHNSLTFMEPLPWKKLRTLDLRSNLFSGPIPISSAPLLEILLLGSQNQFEGEISTSLCNMTSLQVLDLSYNNLTGKIPPCFSNFSRDLSVLDLRRNQLHGSIPEGFSEESRLRNLNLNGNRLEGTLPRSLMNCNYLEVLDVGNNFLNGAFPDWIESLPHLRVLVLRSNMFNGSIENPKTQFPFKGLRIIDLSVNKFNGPLPTKLFENFKAMENAENVKMEYMGGYYYKDSVMVTMKGITIELVKIQTIFTTIDFSCNNFTGEIPSLIGRLKSLKGLNFSHNMLSGTIPSTLGDLTNLEWLDFSSNSLVGNIPSQLASNLYQLQKLNLSNNKLDGLIPRGPQFDTFTEDSYSGNLQLCGFPLSKSCQEDSAMSKVENGDKEESDDGLSLNWKLVMMGYGSGIVIGISIGYMSLFSRSFDYWLSKRSVKAQQKKIDIARSRVGRRRSNLQHKR